MSAAPGVPSAPGAPPAPSAPGDLGSYVDELVQRSSARLHGDEVLLANFSAEDADFIRFNNGAVRQAGSVRQRAIGLELVAGARHTRASQQLTGELAVDEARLADALDELRQQRAVVPDDPYLSFNTEVAHSSRIGRNELPDADTAMAEVRSAARGRDLVGIYAAGTTYRGFANSLGQRNWYEVSTFGFDWSFHLRADKAAKNSYAGFAWSSDEFARKVQWSARQLEVLDRPPLDLAPGRYRALLAPAAVVELTDLLGWGGFGLRSHRTKQTPLLRMVTEGATFHPDLNVAEDTAGGVAANFQAQGFAKPDEVVLIDGGRYGECLVSPRSAQEYGVATNGASDWEAPESIAVAPGTLPTDRALAELDTGLYIGNLWYLNYSDRAACRTTGMTRFATFWVERGEIVAPVNVLRFDDSLFGVLGDRLLGLTDRAEVVLDPTSYGARSTSSTRVPGALVDDMVFTL